MASSQKMHKLSARLKMTADFVREGVRLVDIGTDHAYLPSYLVEKGLNPSAVACDLRVNPLENARETLRLCGQEDKIELRLSDGFDALTPDDAEDFVVAGMGGTLITELIGRTPWLCDTSKRLIIQPMSHSQDVRRLLCERGFRILAESACFDAGRCCIALCAEYSPENTDIRDSSYWFFGELANDSSDAARDFVNRQRKWIETRLRSLEAAGIENDETEFLRGIGK